jgi:UDP-N-acetylglucosamine 1-carboxyvinyltransferase
MTDWQPLMATLLTQCQGTSILHETVMAKRFQYVPALQEMGAQIEYFQPQILNHDEFYNFNADEDSPELNHAIRITGSTPLQAGEFAIEDLRHGATLIMAGMIASGTTKLTNIGQVDRGYEDLDVRLRSMGAKIERVTT